MSHNKMSVKSHYKHTNNYYNANVCDDTVCYPAVNLIKLKNKNNVPIDNNMFIRSSNGDELFVPSRLIESDFLPSIRKTLEESSSCWDIDPCHKNLEKYCCKSQPEIVDATNNKGTQGNIFLVILVFIVIIAFVGIGIAMFMF